MFEIFTGMVLMEFLAFRTDQDHRLIIKPTGDAIKTERMRTGYLDTMNDEHQLTRIGMSNGYLTRIRVVTPAKDTGDQSGTNHRSPMQRNGENLENSEFGDR